MVSLLAAAANFFILRSGGNSGSAIATGCVFMGVFTYAGMRLISRIRSALRPRVADPNELDPGAAPPHGGWANPTGLQSVMDRIRRAISQIRRT